MPKGQRRKRVGGDKSDDEPIEPMPLTPPVVFTKDRLDPRFFVKPGEPYRPYNTVPSRPEMLLTYIVIAGVTALVLFGCVLALLHR